MKPSPSFFATLKNSIIGKTLSVLLVTTMLLAYLPMAFAASATISGSLVENMLNGASVSITLTDDTFLDATLSSGNFVLNNAPSGVSISGVTFNSSTTATLTLAFNNTDFDTNVTNFNITINAAELTSNTNLTSNNLTITAIVEASPALTISGSLSESNLNTTSLSISLANETFKDSTLDKANFTLNNPPSGTIVSAVSYGSSTSATLSFSFNNTDFDTNITNFSITINGAELTSNGNLTSNTLTITAVQEAPTVSISGSLNESNLNGAVVAISITNDTFKDTTLDKANFTLNNAPSGTTIASVSYGSSTTANLTLAFTGTDFDTNVTNFTIIIGSAELTSNASVISNALTITAVVEGSDTVKPTISSVTIDSSKKIITLNMSENINRVGTLSDLKSKIRFASDGANYNSLGSGDSVADINGSDKKLIITLETAISGSSNRMRILADAIKDAANNQNVELTTSSFSSSGTGTDTTKPTIDSVTVDHTLRVVTINFSENIIRATSSSSSLKSKIRFAADGSNYEALSSSDTISDPDGNDGKLIITFDNEISGTKNKIRIDADAIKDESGNKNIELTTSAFRAEDSEKPYIKTATMDSAKKVVTITFQEDIDKSDTLSTLKSKIKFAANGTDFVSLASADTVADLDGSDNVLQITFDTALSGSKNKIKILSGAIEDNSGNKNIELITNSLSTSSSSLPTIASVSVNNDNKTITLTFSENIDRTSSLSSLKDDIQFAPDGSDFNDLDTDDEVSDTSGKTLTITFADPISGSKNKIRIAQGALEDSDGNENDQLTSPAFSERNGDVLPPEVDEVDVNNERTRAALTFNEDITRVGNPSDLREKILLATDGVNFEPLSSDDEVSDPDGTGATLFITFDEALNGLKNKIKILEGAIQDDAGNKNEEFLISALELNSSIQNPFTDLRNHWAEDYVTEIYRRGIVEGRDATHYAPDANLNRAELTKMALKAFDISVPGSVTVKPFLDVELDSWYVTFVAAAKAAGIIGGYIDGNYYPGRDVSRAEALKIMLEASGLNIGNGSTTFTDTEPGAWYQKYLAYAEDKGIVGGYSDGSFGPERPVTRAEIAKMLTLILAQTEL